MEAQFVNIFHMPKDTSRVVCLFTHKKTFLLLSTTKLKILHKNSKKFQKKYLSSSKKWKLHSLRYATCQRTHHVCVYSHTLLPTSPSKAHKPHTKNPKNSKKISFTKKWKLNSLRYVTCQGHIVYVCTKEFQKLKWRNY